MTTMNSIREIKRFASPVELPQSLSWDGSHFWMGSMATESIYKMDPSTWEILWQTKAPGVPFSIIPVENELRVLCGETEEDYRFIRRCLPGQEFDKNFEIPCPDDTGSQLSYDGKNLRVSQWYNQLVLTLDDAGKVIDSIRAPHGICGQVVVGDMLYLATTDEEEHGDYWITRINLKDPKHTAEDIALIPFQARSLTFDGQYFWTNHRAKHETVCFTIED